MATAVSVTGDNKTGIQHALEQAQEMIDASAELASEPAEAELAQKVRDEYARDAEPLGSVPPTGTTQRPAKGAKPKRSNKIAALDQFVDKLGERLAFERTGVRLYQALIGKLESYGGFSGGPDVADLEQILEEELLHFQMLERAITQLGGDPTAVTPAADFSANVSKGIGDVLGDPRTTFVQCLEAILAAELVDNDAWEALCELALGARDEELADRFVQARQDEAEHLVKVRRWLAIAQGRQTPR